MDHHNAFLAGATIGLTIAAPVGPMAVLCIRRTLVAGFRAGLSTGAGASSLHIVYSAITLAGIEQIAGGMKSNHRTFDAISACVMIYFAWRILRPRPTPGGPAVQAAVLDSLIRNYTSALGFGSLNPMLPLLTIGAISTVIGADRLHPAETAILLCGVFLGSFGWWCTLTGTIAAIGGRSGPQVTRVLDLATGIFMGFLALLSLHHLVLE